MNFTLMFFIALALASECFSIALNTGRVSSYRELPLRAALTGLTFGAVTGAVTLAAYLIWSLFGKNLVKYDHWIAFALLLYAGTDIIISAFRKLRVKQAVSAEPKAEFSTLTVLKDCVSVIPETLAAGLALAAVDTSRNFAMILVTASVLVLSVAGAAFGRGADRRLAGIFGVSGGALMAGVGLSLLLQHLLFGA